MKEKRLKMKNYIAILLSAIDLALRSEMRAVLDADLLLRLARLLIKGIDLFDQSFVALGFFIEFLAHFDNLVDGLGRSTHDFG